MEKLHRKACFIKERIFILCIGFDFNGRKSGYSFTSYTIRILLESLLRKEDGVDVTKIT